MLMATPPAARISAIVAARRTVIEGRTVMEVARSVIQGDLVAEAAQIPDQQAGAGQLAPEARDVQLDRVQADLLVVEREQLLEDALLRHDPAAIEHQDFQHAELPAGQLERRSRDACGPP